MRKYLTFLCVLIVATLVLGLAACGGGGAGSGTTSSQPAAPSIAKVKIWLTLSNNPDAPPVTMLTPEQTIQASIWARGTTEETVTFKVNLYYGDKLTTLAQNIRTEGSSKTVAVGALANPLEPGSYTFKAHSGSFGEVVGSLTIMVTAPPLSEQPDKATFNKYFSDMGLGRLPAGGQLPNDLQKNVTTFTAGDQISLYGNIIEECQLRNAIYDVQAKKVVKEGGLPKPMKGGFAGAEPLDIPSGKYEFKVYVGSVLVAIFPFEVH
jgi:hypothetical protein